MKSYLLLVLLAISICTSYTNENFDEKSDSISVRLAKYPQKTIEISMGHKLFIYIG